LVDSRPLVEGQPLVLAKNRAIASRKCFFDRVEDNPHAHVGKLRLRNCSLRHPSTRGTQIRGAFPMTTSIPAFHRCMLSWSSSWVRGELVGGGHARSGIRDGGAYMRRRPTNVSSWSSTIPKSRAIQVPRENVWYGMCATKTCSMAQAFNLVLMN
jgi:hypothetical protein